MADANGIPQDLANEIAAAASKAQTDEDWDALPEEEKRRWDEIARRMTEPE